VSGWSGGRVRFPWVASLLVLSVVLMAVLAAQAHYAFVYHRATAEKALRDFAALAGEEFVRRATVELGAAGRRVLLPQIQRRAGPQGLPADLRQRLLTGDEPLAHRALPLARRFFVAEPGEGRIAFAPDAPPPGRLEWLRDLLRRPTDYPRDTIRVHHAVFDGERYSVVFTPTADLPQAAAAPPWTVVGFELDPEGLRGLLAAAVNRSALLPSSLGGGRVTNDALSLSVTAREGPELFRAGGGPWPLAADVPFALQYSTILDGASVRVSIDPAAARHLVIGGLPRSRLPLLLGLLALSAGLVAAAIVQLRRERALQRLRDEFVSSVSHELRTPLTQIRMFAETLRLERIRTPEEGRRALEIIDREATRLTHLVENVLRFSRGERGVVTLAPDPRALAPMAREVLEQFQPLIAGTEVTVRLELDEEAVAAVDADALRQVLLNLLDNAVKYGPRTQEILVTVERRAGLVALGVEDEGPGVPPAERRRIFDRFHRLERDRRSAVAGTGIGLAVARDLVERHGGRCFVEPGGRGGARFVVELPEADG
jgi:signal transduction histidine kinase